MGEMAKMVDLDHLDHLGQSDLVAPTVSQVQLVHRGRTVPMENLAPLGALERRVNLEASVREVRRDLQELPDGRGTEERRERKGNAERRVTKDRSDLWDHQGHHRWL